MERHNKSKEAALLEAEKILKSALERVLIVEEVQNQNFELRRQIEICQARNFQRLMHYVGEVNLIPLMQICWFAGGEQNP